jgi:hypothetical protein
MITATAVKTIAHAEFCYAACSLPQHRSQACLAIRVITKAARATPKQRLIGGVDDGACLGEALTRSRVNFEFGDVAPDDFDHRCRYCLSNCLLRER